MQTGYLKILIPFRNIWIVFGMVRAMFANKFCISKISPGRYIFQRTFLRGLFSEGAYIRRGIFSESLLLANTSSALRMPKEKKNTSFQVVFMHIFVFDSFGHKMLCMCAQYHQQQRKHVRRSNWHHKLHRFLLRFLHFHKHYRQSVKHCWIHSLLAQLRSKIAV